VLTHYFLLSYDFYVIAEPQNSKHPCQQSQRDTSRLKVLAFACCRLVINITAFMIATLVYIQVKPEFLNAFKDATQKNHENSIKENGNLRFDILQDAQDPCKFVLYEAYKTEEAVAAHKSTEHYFTWRDTVSPWMAGPREGVKHLMLFPRPE
jgi:autoinducer 2-degrading protein